jgi:twitching motility protein PilT
MLVPLFDKLKELGADRLVLDPGEPVIAETGDERRPIGKSPVGAATILEAAADFVSHDELAELPTNRPRIVRHEHGGEPFVIEIVRRATGVGMVLRAATPGAKGAAASRGAVSPANEPKPRKSQRPPKNPSRPAVAMPQANTAPGATLRVNSRELAALDLDAPLELEASPRRGAAPPALPTTPATPAVASGARPPIAHAAEPQMFFGPTVSPAAVGATPAAARSASNAGGGAVAPAAVMQGRAPAPEAILGNVGNVGNVAIHAAATTPPVDLPPPGRRVEAAFGGAGGSDPRIDGLLREMVTKKASDLHLTSGAPPVMRVHGEIHFMKDRPILSSSDIESLLDEVMNEKARADFKALHDADFAHEIKGLSRFRMNAFEDRNGVGAVMRQIPIEIVPADKLGLPAACLDLCWLTKGLVVVTGPTGSGKSTTLAAMVDFINKNRNDHIITIEDPVEFVHQNIRCLVNQREVGQHTKSFKNALRAALREDPDIVLVGEMRDLETISIAIETAETGHLVFGTLHTTTAPSTVDRIIDQFPTDRQAQIRVMLSESLKGVVAQVLCPKIGGGRVAAHEILLGTTAVTALIRDGKTFQLPSVMQTGKNAGMVTMNDSLMQLVQKKLVEPKQAYMKAVDKNGLLSMFKGAGLPTTF